MAKGNLSKVAIKPVNLTTLPPANTNIGGAAFPKNGHLKSGRKSAQRGPRPCNEPSLRGRGSARRGEICSASSRAFAPSFGFISTSSAQSAASTRRYNSRLSSFFLADIPSNVPTPGKIRRPDGCPRKRRSS